MLHFQCCIRPMGCTLPKTTCGLREAFTSSLEPTGHGPVPRVTPCVPKHAVGQGTWDAPLPGPLQWNWLRLWPSPVLPPKAHASCTKNDKLLMYHRSVGEKLRVFSVSLWLVSDHRILFIYLFIYKNIPKHQAQAKANIVRQLGNYIIQRLLLTGKGSRAAAHSCDPPFPPLLLQQQGRSPKQKGA